MPVLPRSPWTKDRWQDPLRAMNFFRVKKELLQSLQKLQQPKSSQDSRLSFYRPSQQPAHKVTLQGEEDQHGDDEG
jgi:hypothetical protein